MAFTCSHNEAWSRVMKSSYSCKLLRPHLIFFIQVSCRGHCYLARRMLRVDTESTPDFLRKPQARREGLHSWLLTFFSVRFYFSAILPRSRHFTTYFHVSSRSFVSSNFKKIPLPSQLAPETPHVWSKRAAKFQLLAPG